MAVLSRTGVIPLANYPTGNRTLAIGNIPDEATRFSLELLRCTDAEPTIWPNVATTLEVLVQTSVDGGPWSPGSGLTASGGKYYRLDGQPYSELKMNFPLRAGNNRQLRIYVSVVNGPLRTAGTLELIA